MANCSSHFLEQRRSGEIGSSISVVQLLLLLLLLLLFFRQLSNSFHQSLLEQSIAHSLSRVAM
jgi:hypothetical protein